MKGAGRTVAVLVVIMLAGVACGGSGGKAATQTSTPSSAASGEGCPASAPLPTPASDHGAATATGSAVSIEANDFFFAPTCVTNLSAGSVTLSVHNGGQALHNVTIESLGIDKGVPAGQTVTVMVEMGTSPLPFVCKYHRTSGMVGALLPPGR